MKWVEEREREMSLKGQVCDNVRVEDEHENMEGIDVDTKNKEHGITTKIITRRGNRSHEGSGK